MRRTVTRHQPRELLQQWCATVRRAAWGLCLLVLAAAVPQVGADDGASFSATFHYDAKNRRDPFVPLVRDGRIVSDSPRDGRPYDGSKPVLYGILWDPGGQSIALINDGEAKAGQTVDGYLVKEIRKDAVVLEGAAGEEVVLEISFDAPSSKPLPEHRNGR